MGKKVDEGVIEFRYSIYEEEMDDGVVYHWYAGNGEESDSWFDTPEDATADVTNRYS